ncbi:MAG: hypothetical protein H6999_04070 [Hahellaceae bacterium]|nr:hypothetical protein [Hahellaceae bacterium]MCP5168913.1 hypothetical protein [Hahellaceae bacterium]
MINRYWIYDKDDSKTGFPLGVLLNLIINFLCSEVLKVSVHRAEGYGEKVSSWDEQLFSPEDKVTATLEEVQELLGCDEEILYWLDIEFELANGESFKFGLHDSSSMYVESAADLGDFLNSNFEHVKA